MAYKVKIPSLAQVRGTHYNPDSAYLYFVRGGAAGSGIYRVPVNPVTLIAEGRSVALGGGKQIDLNGYSFNDLQWTGSVLKAMANARVASLQGFTAFDAIQPSDLLAVNWNGIANNNSLPEDGTSAGGRLYAVRIPAPGGDFNYAKVRVYKAGATTYIDWSTFLLSPNPVSVGSASKDFRDIVVSDYEAEIYLSLVDTDGTGQVYLASRGTSGSYPTYTLSYPINIDPLSEPQQLALDGSIVYVVDDTSLWRLDPNEATQKEIVTGLIGGVGLLLDTSGAFVKAYIADNSGLRVVNISDYDDAKQVPIPAPDPAYTLDTDSSGFLTWANDEHTAIYFTDRLTKEVKRLDLVTNQISSEGPTPSTPWSVEVISPNLLYVASDQEIGTISRTIQVSGVLLLGIGLIPFDYINNSIVNPASPAADDGKANTSSAPGYYFSQYPNLPFGGSLSLMLNHDLAWNSGIRYYKISLFNLRTGKTYDITAPFTDMRWNQGGSPPKFEPVLTTPTGGYYPIRNPADLWYNSHLGAMLATSTDHNGHNVLRVDFFDANRQKVANGSFERLLLIDNTRYAVRLEYPRIGTPPPAGYPAPDQQCGCVLYNTKNDLVELDFAAWQPQAVGTYTLRFARGDTALGPLQQSGAVTTTQVVQTKKEVSPGTLLRVGHLLGDCDIGNITITLSVPSRVIDGMGWIWPTTETRRSFTLLKAPLTHTPWP